MATNAGQKSGGGGGTETTGEGEDEESSSSSLISSRKSNNSQLRSLLEDDTEQEKEEIVEGEVRDKNHENVLEQFRQQWRTELQKAVESRSKTNSRDGSPATVAGVASYPEKVPESTKKDAEPGKNANGGVFDQASRLFQNGIDLERRGEMHDAVRCYRQALFLVPDIEKRLLSSTAAAGGRTYAMVASESLQSISSSSDANEAPFTATTEELIEIFRHRLFITNGGTAVCTPADADDEQEDGDVEKATNCLDQQQRTTVHISQLPAEVLMHIFKWAVSSDLDLRQLEQISMVCCGFYMVARDPELWHLACLKVWGVRLGSLDSVYPTWRNMYIERPHVWYNGVYISKITYIRHGEAAYQDQFYRPWHLVIYYRYLRFFPDGTMIMLTTPEDPSIVVPGLKSRQPRFQGMLRGTYRLVGHDCIAGVLTRKNNVDFTSSPYLRNRSVKQPNDLMEHMFSLVLNISSLKRRRHAQLIWSNYEVTARYRNGQTASSKFDLCDQKFPPLYFSRVKSFSAYSEEPL